MVNRVPRHALLVEEASEVDDSEVDDSENSEVDDTVTLRENRRRPPADDLASADHGSRPEHRQRPKPPFGTAAGAFDRGLGQRALAARNLTAAEQAAFEIAFISLAQARELVELYAEKGDPKYERAALKYLSRYLTEVSRRYSTSPRCPRSSLSGACSCAGCSPAVDSYGSSGRRPPIGTLHDDGRRPRPNLGEALHDDLSRQVHRRTSRDQGVHG